MNEQTKKEEKKGNFVVICKFSIHRKRDSVLNNGFTVCPSNSINSNPNSNK